MSTWIGDLKHVHKDGKSDRRFFMNVIRIIVTIIITIFQNNGSKIADIDTQITLLNDTSISNRADAVSQLLILIQSADSFDVQKIKLALIDRFVIETNNQWMALRNSIKQGLPRQAKGEEYGEYYGMLVKFVDSLRDSQFIRPLLSTTVGCCNYPKTLTIYPDLTLRFIFDFLKQLSQMRQELKKSYLQKEEMAVAEGTCSDHILGLSSVLLALLERESRMEYEINKDAKMKIRETGLGLLCDQRWFLREIGIQILYYFADDISIVKKIEQLMNGDPYYYKTEKGKVYPVREAAAEVIKKLEEAKNKEEEEIKKDEK